MSAFGLWGIPPRSRAHGGSFCGSRLERGLIAAAGTVFDVADHVLSGHFGVHVEGYEASLEGLRDHEVIGEGLYERIRELGGLRNVLIHRYAKIDPSW